ncbi:hypothetical protein [Streptomyces mirabilis]|uniref:hypothetical protein n=1 Tax=Streptomyces mirabilis TaxID=68239 RepID=UPI0036BD2FDD
MPGGPVFAGGHDSDGFERVGGVDALAEESAGTGVRGLGDEHVFLEGGEDEDLHTGEVFVGADGPCCRRPSHSHVPFRCFAADTFVADTDGHAGTRLGDASAEELPAPCATQHSSRRGRRWANCRC